VTAARLPEQEQPLLGETEPGQGPFLETDPAWRRPDPSVGQAARSAKDARAVAGETAWPQQVLLHERSGALALRWGAEAPALLAGHRLRAACRCAGCEHARRSGDGHERGIYPWPYLRELALEIAP
jgi:hypothetical protein